MSKTGVIFDMDGVIFDSEMLWKEAFLKANKKFGLNFTEEYRQACCGKDETTIRNELRGNGCDVADEYRDFMCGYVEDITYKKGVPLKDGFNELVTVLKEKEYKLALATSSKKKRALNMFEKASLNPYEIFTSLVFGEDVKVSKPDPEIFLLAAKGLNLPPRNCFVVEDSLNGIDAATSGGFMPVMAIDLIRPQEKQRRECVYIAGNLRELNKYFCERV